MRPWPFLFLILAGAFFPIGPSASARVERSQQAAVTGPMDWTKFKFQGTASCASMACHHNIAARNPQDEFPVFSDHSKIKGYRGGEYGVWAAHDKHFQAYTILFNERSRRIEKNLKNLKSLDEAHPENNHLCLRCHVHPQYEKMQFADHITKEAFGMDGVGCESCHGPAEYWLTQHYQAYWKKMEPADKEVLGMKDTKSLLGRVRVCLDCHVGAGDGEVNHDLIAAGHPRLNFEFGSFHAIMPRHWNQAKDKDPEVDPRGRKDFEARAWILGQIASAQAALKLLEDRAQNGKQDKIWPEFAEYDCYACHHNLKADSARQREGYQGRTPGALPWTQWYRVLIPDLAGKPEEPRNHFAAIAREMQNPYPNKKEVAGKVHEAQKLLQTLWNEWSQKCNGGKDQLLDVNKMFQGILGSHQDLGTATWDEAAQTYLALAALEHARSDMKIKKDPGWSLFIEIRQDLRFDSQFDSPRNFDPRDVRDKLKKLFKRPL